MTPTAPAFTVVVHAGRPNPFTINAEAFARWCDDKDDDLECDVPNWTDPRAGAALSDLFYDALQAEVITGHPGIELNVHGGDDDWESSGFYAVLKNSTGPQRLVGITSGWTELRRLDDATTPRDAAREYLHDICAVANEVLSAISPSASGR